MLSSDMGIAPCTAVRRCADYCLDARHAVIYLGFFYWNAVEFTSWIPPVEHTGEPSGERARITSPRMLTVSGTLPNRENV